MRVIEGPEGLRAAQGEVLDTSDWLEVDQARVDLFAEATGDHQWIHVDPERAASGPYGATIVHGFLTLALLPKFMSQIIRLEGFSMAVNYGLDKVRFISPVKVGQRLRATSELLAVKDVGGGAVQAHYRTTVEIEGAEKPACVAEQIGRYFPL